MDKDENDQFRVALSIILFFVFCARGVYETHYLVYGGRIAWLYIKFIPRYFSRAVDCVLGHTHIRLFPGRTVGDGVGDFDDDLLSVVDDDCFVVPWPL